VSVNPESVPWVGADCTIGFRSQPAEVLKHRIEIVAGSDGKECLKDRSRTTSDQMTDQVLTSWRPHCRHLHCGQNENKNFRHARPQLMASLISSVLWARSINATYSRKSCVLSVSSNSSSCTLRGDI
jgi:hypothetical protein